MTNAGLCFEHSRNYLCNDQARRNVDQLRELTSHSTHTQKSHCVWQYKVICNAAVVQYGEAKLDYRRVRYDLHRILWEEAARVSKVGTITCRSRFEALGNTIFNDCDIFHTARCELVWPSEMPSMAWWKRHDWILDYQRTRVRILLVKSCDGRRHCVQVRLNRSPLLVLRCLLLGKQGIAGSGAEASRQANKKLRMAALFCSYNSGNVVQCTRTLCVLSMYLPRSSSSAMYIPGPVPGCRRNSQSLEHCACALRA